MADYSRSPQDVLLANQQKGYVGLHFEQGVPLLDRDLNLLHDLIAATVRSVVARYIGDGVAANADGFAIQALPAGANANDFLITKGSTGSVGVLMVGGIEATIPAEKKYSDQNTRKLTTPGAAGPRVDTAYVDVFLTEIDASAEQDPNLDLANNQDVGMATSVRLRADWVVRVAEGEAVPLAGPGHSFYALARLTRKANGETIEADMIADLRRSRLTVADIEGRLALMEQLLMVPAFVKPPLPQFLPKSGVMNQQITLNGANFNVGDMKVMFDNVDATIIGAASATQVVAKVPSGLTPDGKAVAVRVKIINPGGMDLSEDQFRVLPAPALDPPGRQFTPTHGLALTPVTIHGFNFNAAGVQVKFDGAIATVVGSPTNTEIVVQTPAGLVPVGVSTADVKITITTSAGEVTSDDSFRAEVNTPAPSFVSPQFAPQSGIGGQSITLTGQNFNFGPVSVKFDTVPAAIVGTPSPSQIAVTVPTGMVPFGGQPRAVKITVTTAGGSVTSDNQFTVRS